MKKRNIIFLLMSLLVSPLVGSEPSSKPFKIAIVGATGNVGKTFAHSLLQNDTIATEILLWGRNEKKLLSEFYDLEDSAVNTTLLCTTHLSDVSQADLIVISAGIHKPISRDELLKENAPIIKSLINKLNNTPNKNENAIIVIVTNPVEDLSQVALDESKKIGYLKQPEQQIIGSGTLLDSLRLHKSLTRICGVKKSEIANAWVLGEHGDSQFPVWSHAKVNGNGLTLTEKTKVQKNTKRKGYSIVSHKKFTQFGIARALTTICNCIKNGGTVPVSVSCPKNEVYLSLLTHLNRNGIEKIMPFKLNESEQNLLQVCINKRIHIKKSLLKS